MGVVVSRVGACKAALVDCQKQRHAVGYNSTPKRHSVGHNSPRCTAGDSGSGSPPPPPPPWSPTIRNSPAAGCTASPTNFSSKCAMTARTTTAHTSRESAWRIRRQHDSMADKTTARQHGGQDDSTKRAESQSMARQGNRESSRNDGSEAERDNTGRRRQLEARQRQRGQQTHRQHHPAKSTREDFVAAAAAAGRGCRRFDGRFRTECRMGVVCVSRMVKQHVVKLCAGWRSHWSAYLSGGTVD